jgi:hypothetical protein
MADNFTTPVPAGSQVATKDIGGVHYAKNIITDELGADAFGLVGASPNANTVLGRLKAVVDGIADVVAELQGSLAITATGLPLPAGAATNATLISILNALAGNLTVTGTFFQATQPVSAAALPLPAGAATSAKQDSEIAQLNAMVSRAAPFDITPHATNALAREIVGLSITGAGTVIFRHPDEGTDRTVTLPAGLYPMRATHIRTGGTATGLTGF